MALNDEYFVQRKLYPNVDYYSGIMLRALGIPTSMFTATEHEMVATSSKSKSTQRPVFDVLRWWECGVQDSTWFLICEDIHIPQKKKHMALENDGVYMCLLYMIYVSFCSSLMWVGVVGF